jgi:hypothetical protein
MPVMMSMPFQMAVTSIKITTTTTTTTTTTNYCKVSVVQVSVNKFTRLKLKPFDNMAQRLN